MRKGGSDREEEEGRGRETGVYNFPDKFRAFSITEVLSSGVGSLVILLTFFSLRISQLWSR